MIKVFKDLSKVPDSLTDKQTNRKRKKCIKDSKYHQHISFHRRYKQQDTKNALKNIYHQKCAFCEQKIIECKDNKLEDCSSTVEHYRPKSRYYWLAYSWDNLLWCCRECNHNKANKFETVKSQVEYEESFKDKIHISTKNYQEIEEPKMIHPELESIRDVLFFFNGIIDSKDERVKYTIKTCELDRGKLNEARKTIIDNFIEAVVDKRLKKESLEPIFKELLNEVKEQKNEFIALRYWIIRNYQQLI
jgi:uncharacterized protein (TIGR02646 family)